MPIPKSQKSSPLSRPGRRQGKFVGVEAIFGVDEENALLDVDEENANLEVVEEVEDEVEAGGIDRGRKPEEFAAVEASRRRQQNSRKHDAAQRPLGAGAAQFLGNRPGVPPRSTLHSSKAVSLYVYVWKSRPLSQGVWDLKAGYVTCGLQCTMQLSEDIVVHT